MDDVRPEAIVEEKPKPDRNPKHGKTCTAEERAVQDAKIARLRADRGFTFAQIAEEMKISEDTAWKGYKRFMAAFAKHHHSDMSVLLSEHHTRAERVWRAHLTKYLQTVDKETGVGDVAILREAMKLQNESFDRLQSAGLLPKRKEEYQAQLDVKSQVLHDFVFLNKPPKKMNKGGQK